MLGKHDFSAFASKVTKGPASRNPIRELRRLDLIEQKGGIRLELEADGFLCRMVRQITGALLRVGGSAFEPEEIQKMLALRHRNKLFRVAPPQGLFLMQVLY